MDLCAVDLVLVHLAALAENGGGAFCTAEHVVLNLLRVLAGKTGTATTDDEQVLEAAKTTAQGGAHEGNGGGAGPEGGVSNPNPNPPPRRYGGMDQSNVGDDEEEDTIFGHEERNQFQEPTLFARVAAPYLCCALVALLESRNAGAGAVIFPEPILQGLAGVLKSLSDKLEGLKGLAVATWSPGVYDGIVSSAAVAAAVFEFFSARDCCEVCGAIGDDGGDGDGDDAAVVGLVLPKELARAKKSCEEFEAVLSGNEDVHPAVSRAVGFALAAARSNSA